jgi:hypothetical protein
MKLDLFSQATITTVIRIFPEQLLISLELYVENVICRVGPNIRSTQLLFKQAWNIGLQLEFSGSIYGDQKVHLEMAG